MESQSPSLTVILLMYNEALNIVRTLEETRDFLEANLTDFEIVVVDDGSTDGSGALATSFAAGHPFVHVITHEKNRGMGAGLTTGIAAARKEYFTFNAADGQIPAVEIGKMLPLLAEADMVLTTYADGRESLFRGALSRCLRVYMQIVAGLDIRLQGLYLFPTAAAQKIAPTLDAQTFFFSFALIACGREMGLRPTWTTIRCLPRASGKSKVVNAKQILSVAAEAIRFGQKKRNARRAVTRQ